MAFPSTFVDIQNQVINRVRLDSTADLQKVKDWINEVYYDVCLDTEAIQNYSTMTLTAGTAVYTVSTTAERIKSMYVTPVGGQQSPTLQRTSIEQLIEWNQANGGTNVTSSSVTHYATFGLNTSGLINIQFFPTPHAADTITMYFVQLPTALSSDGDTPILPEPFATRCLVNGASFRAAMFLKDPDAQVYKQEYEEARAALRAHLNTIEGSGTTQFRIVGSAPVIPNDPSTDTR